MENEIDFTLSIENGKYTIRWFKNSRWDILRYDERWIDDTTTIPGAKMWIAVIFELHAYRTGQGTATAQLPRAFAEDVVRRAKLPSGADGKTPLPVTASRLTELIALAITLDRARGPLDPNQIVKVLLDDQDVPEWAVYSREQAAGLIRTAVQTAQARGARIEQRDAHAAALMEATEAFILTLRNKGLL